MMVTQDSLVVIPKRRGRPRAEQPMSTVSTWIPEEHHDQLVRLAQMRGVSVSEVVKSLIVVGLTKSMLR